MNFSSFYSIYQKYDDVNAKEYPTPSDPKSRIQHRWCFSPLFRKSIDSFKSIQVIKIWMTSKDVSNRIKGKDIDPYYELRSNESHKVLITEEELRNYINNVSLLFNIEMTLDTIADSEWIVSIFTKGSTDVGRIKAVMTFVRYAYEFSFNYILALLYGSIDLGIFSKDEDFFALLFFFSVTEHSNDNHAFAENSDILYTNPAILNENIGDDNIEGVYRFMERASIDVDRLLGEGNEEVYETVQTNYYFRNLLSEGSAEYCNDPSRNGVYDYLKNNKDQIIKYYENYKKQIKDQVQKP
jgi:hypothetical protein